MHSCKLPVWEAASLAVSSLGMALCPGVRRILAGPGPGSELHEERPQKRAGGLAAQSTDPSPGQGVSVAGSLSFLLISALGAGTPGAPGSFGFALSSHPLVTCDSPANVRTAPRSRERGRNSGE